MDYPRSMSFKFQGRMVTSSFMRYIFTSYICLVGSFNPFLYFVHFIFLYLSSDICTEFIRRNHGHLFLIFNIIVTQPSYR